MGKRRLNVFLDTTHVRATLPRMDERVENVDTSKRESARTCDLPKGLHALLSAQTLNDLEIHTYGTLSRRELPDEHDRHN